MTGTTASSWYLPCRLALLQMPATSGSSANQRVSSFAVSRVSTVRQLVMAPEVIFESHIASPACVCESLESTGYTRAFSVQRQVAVWFRSQRKKPALQEFKNSITRLLRQFDSWSWRPEVIFESHIASPVCVCGSLESTGYTRAFSVQRQVAVWFRSQRMNVASWYSAPSTKACTSRIQEFNHSLASTVRQLVMAPEVIFESHIASPAFVCKFQQTHIC
jgi:hypothetical protein